MSEEDLKNYPTEALEAFLEATPFFRQYWVVAAGGHEWRTVLQVSGISLPLVNDDYKRFYQLVETELLLRKSLEVSQ